MIYTLWISTALNQWWTTPNDHISTRNQSNTCSWLDFLAKMQYFFPLEHFIDVNKPPQCKCTVSFTAPATTGSIRSPPTLFSCCEFLRIVIHVQIQTNKTHTRFGCKCTQSPEYFLLYFYTPICIYLARKRISVFTLMHRLHVLFWQSFIHSDGQNFRHTVHFS